MISSCRYICILAHHASYCVDGSRLDRCLTGSIRVHPLWTDHLLIMSQSLMTRILRYYHSALAFLLRSLKWKTTKFTKLFRNDHLATTLQIVELLLKFRRTLLMARRVGYMTWFIGYNSRLSSSCLLTQSIIERNIGILLKYWIRLIRTIILVILLWLNLILSETWCYIFI